MNPVLFSHFVPWTEKRGHDGGHDQIRRKGEAREGLVRGGAGEQAALNHHHLFHEAVACKAPGDWEVADGRGASGGERARIG